MIHIEGINSLLRGAVIHVIEEGLCGVCGGDAAFASELTGVQVWRSQGVELFIDPSHEQPVHRVAHGNGSPPVWVLPGPFYFKDAKLFGYQPRVGYVARLIAQLEAAVDDLELCIGEDGD